MDLTQESEREVEDIVRVRGTADLTVAPEAVYTGSGAGEDVEGLTGAGRAVGPAAASYKQGKLTVQQQYVGTAIVICTVTH